MSTYTFNIRYDHTFNNLWWVPATVDGLAVYVNSSAWANPNGLWFGVITWYELPDLSTEGQLYAGTFNTCWNSSISYNLGPSYLAISAQNGPAANYLPSDARYWEFQGWDTSTQANLTAQLVTFFGKNISSVFNGVWGLDTIPLSGTNFNLVVFDGTTNFDNVHRHIAAFCYQGTDPNAGSQSVYSF